VAAVYAPVTEALVAAVRPRPTDVVLDLAAGTGDVTAALGDRVQRVISTDLSPVMVEAARRRGVANAEHRVLDMQELDLPDASVDAVVSRFGFMLVPDLSRALRETRRVLRPGGTLAFATWATAKRNPWATAYGPVLIERGLQQPPKPGEPGQFALGRPEEIEPAVRAAGFDEVWIQEVPVEYRFGEWREYAHVMTSLAASLRELLGTLDEATRAEIDDAAHERLARFRTDAGYVLPGVALVTTAR
jgi:SAM-dependent methyltransferase